MRRRARGIVELVVLSLGLGVVTTYGVAWVLMNTGLRQTNLAMLQIALESSESGPPRRLPISEGWRSSVKASSGSVTVISARRDRYSQDSTVCVVSNSDGPVPAWSDVHRISPSMFEAVAAVRPNTCYLIERCGGWPRLAVIDRSAEELGGKSASAMSGGLSIRWTNGQKRPESVLPLVPLWPGFAGNVAVFGLGWLLSIRTVKCARRRIRERAGRCPTCRYDLNGLTGGVCPECGSTVKGT